MAAKRMIDKLVSRAMSALKTLHNFIRASALSLLVILIILLLLNKMDQALTMMVDLIESPKAKFSLLLSLYLINALALALSHYPIYTYYAADLNDSKDYTEWDLRYPFNIWPLNKIPVFVFTTKKDSDYKPDRGANYLRYLLGILIHGVWIYFIVSSFEPNLHYQGSSTLLPKLASALFLIAPMAAYVFFKERFAHYKEQADHAQKGLHPKLDKLYRALGLGYFIVALANLICVILLLAIGNFSSGGFTLLLLTSYLSVVNYFLFRLLRTRLSAILESLREGPWGLVCWFLGRIRFLQASRNYLGMFFVHFAIATGVILFATIGGIAERELANGIPLLLAFFYVYYYLIAIVGKFFFVSRKEELTANRRFKIVFLSLSTIVLLAIITKLFPIESKTHQLDLVDPSTPPMTEAKFVGHVGQIPDSVHFYIASHGGGLKANVWTLNVVNHLQQRTKGQLMEHAVALSGASGGSLGLALYTGLYRSYGKDTQRIQLQIDSLSRKNYTSVDLAFTFGLDTYRKIWPLNQRIGVRDRPYYAMRKYQNLIETKPTDRLSELDFRSYWNEAYPENGHYPSLIMNTAGTAGNRGILWSVKADDFDQIFPNSENLADLNDGKTLPFYQAVSTTNRFPVFSPAAKIPGYGHYIDAGAIDNSGLLGCLDLYYHLGTKHRYAAAKQTVFVEIINSKGLYIRKLLKEFRQLNGIDHLKINEKETDNLVADLQTGLNLDKIPQYLSDFLEIQQGRDPGIQFVRIFMPHKVSIEEAEASLGGKMPKDKIRQDLKDFLSASNNKILALTPTNSSGFNAWPFYEPTLSRHLSESSISYLKEMLKHPDVMKEFEAIDSYLSKNNLPNENP